jgi:hypothetical protein
MRLNDDDIVSGGSGGANEGPADGGANSHEHDGAADGTAAASLSPSEATAADEGVADGGANTGPEAEDGGADGTAR